MGVSLSSLDDVAQHIRAARTVDFGAYLLAPGRIERALVDAATAGAHVSVCLQRDPYRGGSGERHLNRDAARVLRAAGATVALLDRSRAPFHLKAAVCDETAFLDDRNWTQDGRETILADDRPRDVAAVRRALAGLTGIAGSLATRKDAALRLEAELIDRAVATPVVVETESFGAGAVSAALQRHAQRGDSTTLIVSASEASRNAVERALLRRLRNDGIVVRETSVNEKLALVGDTVWVGSANATYAGGGAGAQTDWGLITRDAAIVAAGRAALSRDASA